MANETKVTLAKDGELERVLPISQIPIPDLWHIAEAVRHSKEFWAGKKTCDLILEVWYLAHDFKRHIQES